MSPRLTAKMEQRGAELGEGGGGRQGVMVMIAWGMEDERRRK